MLAPIINKKVTYTASVVHSPFTVAQAPLIVGVASEPGYGEKQNTDSYRLVEVYTPTPAGTVDTIIPVAIVAGAAQAGNTPAAMSQLAVDTIYAALRRQSDQVIQQRLVEALQGAQQTLALQTTDDGQPATDEGVSIVAAAILRNTVYLAYSGECRAYLISHGAIQPLINTAHRAALYLPTTFPSKAPRSALLPLRRLPSEQQGKPPASAIPQPAPSVAASAMPQSPTHQPRTYQLTLHAGDTLLLCTPGLYRAVSEEAMRDTVVDQHPQTAAWQLAIQANQARAADSYTALLIQQTQKQTSQRAGARRVLYRGLLLLCCLLLVIVQLFAFAQWGKAPLTTGNQTLPVLLVTPVVQASPVTGETAAQPAAAEFPQPLPNDAQPAAETPAAIADARASAAATATPAAVPVAARLWTRLALTATISAFSQNFANTLQKAGNAVAAAQTATASAPLPTPTATATPTPTSSPTLVPPTLTPTRPPATRRPTPTPTHTPTAPVVQPARNDFANARVTLLEPVEYDTLADKRPFRWQANFALPPGYAFELVFWQHSQDPLKQGKGYAGLTTSEQINASYEHFRQRNGLEGEYRWGVLLVRQAPYQRIKYLGGGRVIYVKQP